MLVLMMMAIERMMLFFSFFLNRGGDALLFSYCDESEWMSSNLGS
jgi:hypothetical protein